MNVKRWYFIKLGFLIVLLLSIVSCLHYILPQKEIVRITNVDVKRHDFSKWNRLFFSNSASGDAATLNRDLRLINSVRANGSILVFRNEDTGLNWPFYFKFDTADLQAQASDLSSSEDNPKWVMIKHYGWRSNILSIYPNAVKLKEVASPLKSDLPLINRYPYFNILFLICFGLFLLGLYRLYESLKIKRIDPMRERVLGVFSTISDYIQTLRG